MGILVKGTSKDRVSKILLQWYHPHPHGLCDTAFWRKATSKMWCLKKEYTDVKESEGSVIRPLLRFYTSSSDLYENLQQTSTWQSCFGACSLSAVLEVGMALLIAIVSLTLRIAFSTLNSLGWALFCAVMYITWYGCSALWEKNRFQKDFASQENFPRDHSYLYLFWELDLSQLYFIFSV